MRFGVGVIEGFYGGLWSEVERLSLLGFLTEAGFNSYLYAPKADAALRSRWREEPDAAWVERMQRLVDASRSAGIYFGVGLSPLGADADPAGARRDIALAARRLAALGLDSLAVLFDDMPAPAADAAVQQASLVAAAADAAGISRLLVCPTWYSDDPSLADHSGPCPPDYLETLGMNLDRDIGVFWTGTQVCTRHWSLEHLRDVASRLGRRPVLWDNYPVNDGPEMCGRLHLGAVEGRGIAVTDGSAGVFANPMTQCWLSRPPLLTLPWNLWQPGYDPEHATVAAFHQSLPETLAGLLERDWKRFAEPGLEGLDDETAERLAADYLAIEHPAAAEVVAWLRGETRVAAAEVSS